MHSDQAETMKAKFLVWSPPRAALPIVLRISKELAAASASNQSGIGVSAAIQLNTILAGTVEQLKFFVNKFIHQ
jgi:hypothetical protein